MDKYIWNANLENGKYRNPILYADYSDPDAIRVGSDYYMVASSFSNAPGLPLLHSKDLVNWDVVNYIIKEIPDVRYRKPIHGCGVWAPSIRYHNGLFYVCFPMPDEGIFMCTAKDPLGEWSEPINIRPGAGWIDPCPFWDDDGQAYLVAGVAKSRIGFNSVLMMTRMQPDGMGVYGEEVRIFEGIPRGHKTIEGPKLYKRNGYYYIFAPAGGVKPGWQTVLRSKEIWGPYEDRIVLQQGNTMINGPHQGAWVDTVSGEDWFLHFQDVYAAGRIIHLQPMKWIEDWPIIGQPVDGKCYGEPVTEYTKPNVGDCYLPVSPQCSDDFAKEMLGLQWQWNANYEDNWFRIGKGHLELRAVYDHHIRAVSELPNLLIQKWPGPEFLFETSLDVTHLQKGDRAGIVHMAMKYASLFVERLEQQCYLKTIVGEQRFENGLCVNAQEENQLIPCETTVIRLRYRVVRVGTSEGVEGVTAPDELVTMYYAKENEWIEACSFHALAGRWVGAKCGFFCCSSSEQSTGYALFEPISFYFASNELLP